MTVWTQEADMPWIELPGEYIFTFEAISPTTGLAITGVNVSEVAIYGPGLNVGTVDDVGVPEYTADEVPGL
jgi:hypothetical protein